MYYFRNKDFTRFGTSLEPIVEDEDKIAMIEEEYYQHVPREVVVPTISKEQRKKMMRVEELKLNLASTDYQAIKYAEGEMSVEDYAPIKEQRRQWRAEINQLQAELDAELNNQE